MGDVNLLGTSAMQERLNDRRRGYVLETLIPAEKPSARVTIKVWTMPNTMPGFCIEAFRGVATMRINFVRNLLSRRSL